MYVPEKLKLNKFRDVRIPTAAEYFRRFGQSLGELPSGRFSGDESISMDNRKTIMLSDMEARDQMLQREELAKKMSESTK